MRSVFSTDLDAELKDIGILNYYAGAHRSMAWSTLAPYEEPALREYILPFIGQPLYTVLHSHIEGDTENAELEEASDLLRRTIVYYLMYDATPDLNVQLSDLGPQQISDQNGTTSNPSQWAFKLKVWNLMRKADQCLDQLLQFMDTATGEPFVAWRASVEKKRASSQFFHSPAEINEYLNIQGARRAYDTIIPYFRKAEWRYLIPVLGEPFFEELGNHYRQPPEEKNPLLDRAVLLAQRCLAEFGLIEALPHLSCVIGGETIVIVSKRDGFDERLGSGLVYNQAALSRLQQSATVNGGIAIKDLQSFLRKNADTLTTYKESEAYTTATATVNVIADPDSGAVFF